ncbi:glycine cleavage T protein (aminomethyl transferase) [Segniliparus rotundus DSM 44985]|uniref:Glycine cleavage T protein (Aminomethyl transferase) n=1 Tax=Segniliparus rotundus (strain ATCC BAA-972 / CDC 1076 / CIP 108378 / DSM 44985 / JCM 13578) TaxID=640132 RepID=D6ZBG1_SEGRD|nr:FAD-dependent oxidoreductase [Segniliparus rotundus]ADG98913.1 glycine cleavage T protein (aminomethyl transferase) [Segniliparus rotundus DSM 44985]
MTSPKVVIIGAGVVGCSLADELTGRGWTDVTVLDRGPLFATGGSTSHAPGLVFQTNSSKTMSTLARRTVEKFLELGAFDQVGGLEVATTEARMAELRRKSGWARSWGIQARLIGPEECAALHPLLLPEAVLGGLHTPTDGLALALRAAESQAERASARGARFFARREALEILEHGGRACGVRTAEGDIAADFVVCCAGFWGAEFAKKLGLAVPLLPMAHQYATTGQLPGLPVAGLPILRHQDQDLYYRAHGDRLGIGSYSHRPIPVDMGSLAVDTADEPMPSMLPFTEEDFAPAWRASMALLPALAETKVEEAFNGVFSFTPDGFPILGEHRELPGLWTAEAVWVTHSAGVAAAMAEWMVDGTCGLDLHECDLNRFEQHALSPTFVAETSARNFIEVYDIIHPHEYRTVLRGLRTSPFHSAQQELGASFFEGGGWERPAWFEANAPLLAELREGGTRIPERDGWSDKFYSPISIAEAAWTRERVALYDMTPLTRYEVAGPGALSLLDRLTTNVVDKPVGSVVYTLMLDERGGVRSDLTVARLGAHTFQVAVNGPLDFDWISGHLPDDGSVTLRDITGGTCCVGVWGPLARALAQPLCPDDLSHEKFRYFTALRTYLGAIPVTLLRVSYVGELGWEVYASAEHGRALWDVLREAGREHGVIAAGRVAFNSLRVEKGYRLWGTDVTTEHTPAQAGLGFAVRMGKGDFIGRAALAEAPAPPTMLRSLVFKDPDAVVLGKEPVLVAGSPVGYVTSAGWSATIGRCIAYAWLPAETPIGAEATVDYFGAELAAVVSAEPVVDPEMARIKR